MEAAALSLNVDSSKVVQAANDLDRFTKSSDRAAAAATKVSFGNQAGSIAKLVASVQSIDAKMTALIGTVEKLASAERTAAAANDNMASSVTKAGAAVSVADSHVIAYTQHLAAMASAQRNANSHVIAYQNNLASMGNRQVDANAHVLAYRESLNKAADGAKKAGATIKFTAQDSLNATRQLADIGVTAASGMSPFMILLQQGPQLLDILQSKAAETGQSTASVFKAAAVAAGILKYTTEETGNSIAESASSAAETVGSIGEAYDSAKEKAGDARAAAQALGKVTLGPLGYALIVLAAALGLAAAGFWALTKQANDDSGLKKYTTAMGYTKEEVKKLNAVTVTFGDTVKATFQVALESAANALGINTTEMAKTWEKFLDRLATGTRATLAGIYAGFAGTRAYLGELEKGGLLGIGKMLIGQGDPQLIEKTYGKAYQDGQKALDRIVKQARANARSRQDEMAKAMYDKPADKNKADPLGSILRQAEAEVKAEQARAQAVGLSARAAAELEQKTKILNQIEKAKIPVTDELRAKVEGLAKAYADAKIAADTAAAVQGVVDGLQKQGNAINDQLALVGSYGDALTKARIEVEALAKARDALPKGETLTPEQSSRVIEATKPVVSDQINLDRANRMEKLRKDSEDAAYAMDLERKGLGLTGAAAEAYAFTMERLNQAKRDGIELSPEEIAAIEAAGEAYGKARYAIDQQAQAIADARETTKSFFTDLINGVREGSNAFTALGNAAVNALNRIIDKLLDKALDGFLNGMFSGMSGGSGGGGLFSSIFGGGSSSGSNIVSTGATPKIPDFTKSWEFNPVMNANGGVYGAARKFAKGGSFTNSIVNTPTLFRFANGAALGEMGEAGPEAIMPLKRGANGVLGVQASGSGSRKAEIKIDQHFNMEGVMTPNDVAAMVRQGAAQAVQEVKRNLDTYLREWDVDGAVSS